MRVKHLIILSALFIMACSKDDGIAEKQISLVSVTANGTELNDGAEQVPIDLELSLTFNAVLNAESITSALSIRSAENEVPLEISFTNANSKVLVKAGLNYGTNYTLTVDNRVIGQNSGRLQQTFTLIFSTAPDDTIRSMPPCTSGCLETVGFSIGSGMPSTIDFYRNYPVYEEKVKWEKLTSAIIVIHGSDRNADDYFSYISTALSNAALENSTALIAPLFKDGADAAVNDLYWNTNDWREGQNSDDNAKHSSFAVIDSLIKQLADKSRFPALKKIIITGHSSGALFTQAFAGANKSEPLYPEMEFEYIVANSQYFYYPQNFRYDEQKQSFFTPTNCLTFNHWPMGYHNTPPYLNGVNESDFNNRFIGRNIIYLLGNGTANDLSLNTSDCAAVLLGSSRYQRGENVYRFMENYYAGTHSHSKVIVNGVGHDGNGMYKSPEFKTLITQLLNGQ